MASPRGALAPAPKVPSASPSSFPGEESEGPTAASMTLTGVPLPGRFLPQMNSVYSSHHHSSLPWRKKGQPTPVVLPGELHGQRSLAGYSPRGHKESDTTERLNNNDNNWPNKLLSPLNTV